jgi:hypothetical protein
MSAEALLSPSPVTEDSRPLAVLPSPPVTDSIPEALHVTPKRRMARADSSQWV